ncbi:MAG: hypothetical protein LUD16_12890 [Lachnospiraceae bacterium]|nr:hypothetical protein [Lachnospiraceae bacterium]
MSDDGIFQEFTSFPALYTAYCEVSKGKAEKTDLLRFEYDLEGNLHSISDGLRAGNVPKVQYKSFYVYIPKVRKVIYIDFPNKVIQRALYDAINPRLAKTFISDTYACIPGRGQLAAMLRVKDWMAETRRRPGEWYYWKFDVAKFFYRIDHDVLMQIIRKKIRSPKTVDLLEYYICDTGEPFGIPICDNQLDVKDSDMIFDVGIPIGGGLSHTLGNLYLDPLDQFIKRDLGCHQYIRYMDDGLIFDNNKERLRDNGKRAEEFLNERLKLEFNKKTVLRPARCGVEFVGCNIYDDHVRLRKSTTLHMKRALKKTMIDYNQGSITFERANQTVQSYRATLKHVDMDKFNDSLWSWFVLTKGDLKEALANPAPPMRF